jgi:exosortase
VNLPVWVVALAWVLLVAAFWPPLVGIAGSWFDDSLDMGFGVFVPIAAAYMVWLERNTLRRTPVEPSAWGIVLLVWGAIQVTLGTLAQWVWVSRTAFLISLAGCILTLYGVRMFRRLVYPFCSLILMIAPPTFLFEKITLPLQLLASRLGEISLETLGFSVLREGNILELVGERLAVEEACSGIRSLMALFFLCVVYCFFFVPENGIRAILLAAVTPIAILCNAGRIVATGVVGQYDRQLAHGMLHATFGHFGLALGACLCVLLHWIILISRRKVLVHAR